MDEIPEEHRMNVKRNLDDFPVMKEKPALDFSKQVLPMSGGIVSTVLCYAVKNDGYTIYPLAYNWGKIKNSQAMKCVKRTCEKLKLDLKTADFTGLGELLEEGITDPLVIANRDLLYLGASLSYALVKKVGTLHYPIYMVNPDHAKQIGEYAMFLRNIVEGNDRAGGMGGGRCQLAFNFWQNQEFEIIELGDILNVPWEDTWSCFLSEEIHCGKCPGCLTRKKSFELANIKDTTKYKE